MAKIIEGDADGVKVELDLKNNRAIITTVNNFDVYWMLSRKDNLNRPYAESIANPALPESLTDAVDAKVLDRSKAYFAVPLRSLTEPYKIEEFNKKILTARSFSKQVKEEHDSYEYVVSFDHSDGKNAQFKPSFPKSGYAAGKVVHSGKFFAVLEQGVKDDNRYFQVIKTSAILSGADEFLNREEAVAKKLPLGSMRRLTLGDKGKLEITEYTPRNTSVQEPVQLPITQEQKTALMNFREANNPRDPYVWKEKLMSHWMRASYPGVPENQRGLLQQVRNEQGPDWLTNLDVKDLYLGTTKDSSKAFKPTLKKQTIELGGRG